VHVVAADVEEVEVLARVRREDPLLRERRELLEREALGVRVYGDVVSSIHLPAVTDIGNGNTIVNWQRYGGAGPDAGPVVMADVVIGGVTTQPNSAFAMTTKAQPSDRQRLKGADASQPIARDAAKT
jgi:hypothetical protein